MLKILSERFRQGNRTSAFPRVEPVLSKRFRGLPQIDASRCQNGCQSCADDCPTRAIELKEGAPVLDLGRCLFCSNCVCPHDIIKFSNDYRLAVRKRKNLFLGREELPLAESLDDKLKKLFGRSLKLRVVSAGGCNACEADCNVLGVPTYDLGRFGIQIVASPRHADGLLMTGPVTRNMQAALLDTYAALPEPKLVIASGACAIAGGPFCDSPETNSGVGELLPVDLYVPGCPPHPYTLLDGLLRLLGKR
ncbi:hydrogenase [Geothermobacter hydrogeniphilus]|uniref:Hydrogenase n=1 Tax=Geothermobacter hydrogeniphilus TaxID=1969733 RepID=A0A2K2H9K3_9BACT|nr:hydrogenase [Geothermobacter hydrogeniphilus]PNU19994.1 hydrogenase [Geothermobacter hydrogeniphilus]